MEIICFKEWLADCYNLDWNQFNNLSDKKISRIRKRWSNYRWEIITSTLDKEEEFLLQNSIKSTYSRDILGLIWNKNVKLVSPFKAVCGKWLAKKVYGLSRRRRIVLLNVVFDVEKDGKIFHCYIDHITTDEVNGFLQFSGGTPIEFSARISVYDNGLGTLRFGLENLQDVKRVEMYRVFSKKS